MASSGKLTIGITSWNSEPFLGLAIKAAQRCTGESVRIVVLDNKSTDESVKVAKAAGAEVISKRCSQPEALNTLLDMSRSRYTLLMHSDVILLNPRWLNLCVDCISERDDLALVSPEDVGCGPYTRTWGKGMPESSFLFFDTKKVRSARRWFTKQRFKIKWPYRAVDFTGEHVTYRLPEMLADRGLRMHLMEVLPSRTEEAPVYTPQFSPKYWGPHLEKLRYGLGNFYRLRGEITHYHNWFDRVGLGDAEFNLASTEQVPVEGGVPKVWLQICTRQFLDDLAHGKLQIPDATDRCGL